MILEYLKHLKRKWYIFLLAVLVIGGAAYFGQSYLYAKEKGGAGKSIEVVRFYKVIAESKQEEIQPVMEEMMNDYIDKAMESVSLVEKDLKYEVAKEKTYIRNQIVEAENTFKVKEFALAGVLGVLGGLFVITILFVRKK